MDDSSGSPRTTVRHPRAALLVPAASLYAAAVEGRWGQVAVVCEHAAPGSLRAAGSAVDRLEHFAAGTGLVFGPATLLGYTSEPGAVTFHATAAQAIQLLDLFRRVLLGQWCEVAHVATVHARNAVPPLVESAICDLRTELATPGAFPHCRGWLWPLRRAPLPARVAHHAWSQLTGGLGGVPLFGLPYGPLTVRTNAPLASGRQPAPVD
ncbi:hypothetical protein ACPPVT_12445 [Angustibacter sp. McL0619]|uniref:hypothetical protein n=1 Tax=Angustibacter sp. McL0619 TaxID=3415676 RepID=UPI003CEE735B